MDYFDLHCDTAYELYHKKADLYSNNLAVSIENYSGYDRKAQIFAVWCDKDKTDDECYLDFLHISSEFKEQIKKYSYHITLCTDSASLTDEEDKRLKAILSVEDARLAGNDISRLEKLYAAGVRLITLGWGGNSVICGSHDTDDGLTKFGFEVLRECENLGITVDVSHLSEKSFWDVAGKAQKPFCATHSNSAMLCRHRRNLSDTQARTVAASGGVVGVSFVGEHLSASLSPSSSSENEVYEAVASHIEHFLAIIPENVCIGSDFDGTAPLAGLENASHAENLAKALINRGCAESTVNRLFFENAYNFFSKSLEN